MRLSSLCALGLGFVVGCGGGGGEPADIVVPGMSANATVYFDDHGILNADCQTDEDCAAVLGYYHAKERWVQMDVQRRFSTGRLTDILNPGLAAGLALPAAIDARALFSSTNGVPAEDVLLDEVSEKTLALLEGYSVGVNAWLDDLKNGEHGAQWPREFQDILLEYPPENAPAWTPSDCLASVLALIELLTNDEGPETAQGLIRAALADDERFSDLFSREPLKHSSVLPPGSYSPSMPMGSALTVAGASRQFSSMSALKQLLNSQQRLNEVRGLLGMGIPGEELGSNNWVIGPSMSSSGNALLSNDPHLGMVNPPIWYLAHLDSKTNGSGTVHAAGVTLAGVPWVVIGQNEHVAWGMTTTVFDFSDVYVEDLVVEEGDPVGVMQDGAMVPFTRVDAVFDFNDGTDTTEELLFVPNHGPVRSIDIDNNIALTLRWTGQDASTDINFLTELNVATNIEEARTALENITTIGQNVVVIDTANNIGWFPYNRVPKRPWATNLDGAAPPWVPLDGASGDYEWDGYFTPVDLPQALNPETGYIATANNDMTGSLFDGDPTNDGYPPLQTSAAPGYRHLRIADLIEDVIGPPHTMETMKEIIDDTHSRIGEDLTPAILAIATEIGDGGLTDDAKNVRDALAAWANFECPTGLDGTNAETAPLVTDEEDLANSFGCTAFHVALREIDLAVTRDDFALVAAAVMSETGEEFTVPNTRGPRFATYHSLLDPDNSEGKLASTAGYWDDLATEGTTEDHLDIVAAALDTAGAFLADKLGNPDQWAWGRLHSLTLESQLAALGLTSYNNPAPGDAPYANNGGLFTVDVANPSLAEDNEYSQNWGPSTRFQCEAFPTGPVCTIQLPGGQSGHIDSPHYDDLLPAWLDNESMPLVFDLETAKENAEETVVLGP